MFTLFIIVKLITKLNLGHHNKFEIEFWKISRRSSRYSHSENTAQNWSFHVVLQRTAKKCAKIYKAHAQLLFCSSKPYVIDVPVAVAVVVFLNSLLCFVHGQSQKSEHKHTTKNFVGFYNHSPLLTMVSLLCWHNSYQTGNLLCFRTDSAKIIKIPADWRHLK